MTSAEALLALTWVGVTAYALTGGADFGAGFWDLFAGGPQRGSAQRKLIEHAIGPVWEANHVWLIFVLVVLWTGFPEAFAAIASSLYVPLTLVAVGVILRGAGFAFRKAVTGVALERLFGATFAASSVITPFFLGTVAGAVASGRVPAGIAQADPLRSFINPTSVLGGVLAVVVCAYLAAVYLTADARRAGNDVLADAFRRRALASGVVAGGVVLGGIAVLHADAPDLFDGLTGRGRPLVAISAVAGLVSLGCVWRRRFLGARVATAAAVTAVLWGWAAGQYPYLLEGEVTIRQAAADPVTIRAVLLSLTVGAVLFVPALVALFAMAQREATPD
ncbi:MAG TPA: cytochrome d ubiquinol oxidase subunit II [Acidimicrobiia bacterium]